MVGNIFILKLTKYMLSIQIDCTTILEIEYQQFVFFKFLFTTSSGPSSSSEDSSGGVYLGMYVYGVRWCWKIGAWKVLCHVSWRNWLPLRKEKENMHYYYVFLIQAFNLAPSLPLNFSPPLFLSKVPPPTHCLALLFSTIGPLLWIMKKTGLKTSKLSKKLLKKARS